jgi:hypothetical protein
MAFGDMFHSPNNCDLKLVVRNEEIQCHSIVVKSRSPVLKQILNKKELQPSSFMPEPIRVSVCIFKLDIV